MNLFGRRASTAVVSGTGSTGDFYRNLFNSSSRIISVKFICFIMSLLYVQHRISAQCLWTQNLLNIYTAQVAFVVGSGHSVRLTQKPYTSNSYIVLSACNSCCLVSKEYSRPAKHATKIKVLKVPSARLHEIRSHITENTRLEPNIHCAFFMSFEPRYLDNVDYT